MSSFSRAASDIFDLRNWTSLCESRHISVILGNRSATMFSFLLQCLHPFVTSALLHNGVL